MGAKSDGYAELGGFSYRSYMYNSEVTPAAAIGAGPNITVYLTDAEKFFPGIMKYKSYVWGFISFSYDPCTDELTGVTASPFGGKVFGWVWGEEGVAYGHQGALQ